MPTEFVSRKQAAVQAEVGADVLLLFENYGWISPQRHSATKYRLYSQEDVARAAEIGYLRFTLKIPTEAIPFVLSLLDREHDLEKEVAELKTLIKNIQEECDAYEPKLPALRLLAHA